jgi:hypothetical protein
MDFLCFILLILFDAKLPARSFLCPAKGGCLPPSGTQIFDLSAGPRKRTALSLKASKRIRRIKSTFNVKYPLFMQQTGRTLFLRHRIRGFGAIFTGG